MPGKLAKALFLDRGADRFTRLTVRLAATPLGRPRLPGLLGRLGVFAALFIGGAAALDRVVEHGLWPLAVPLALPLLWLALAFVVFARYELHLLLRMYPRMRAQYDAFYAEPARYAALTREAAEARFGGPWLRK